MTLAKSQWAPDFIHFGNVGGGQLTLGSSK